MTFNKQIELYSGVLSATASSEFYVILFFIRVWELQNYILAALYYTLKSGEKRHIVSGS